MGAGNAGQHPVNNVPSNGNAGTSSLASNSLVELIEEGARFKDNYKSNSGQLKSAYSMLPCVYNTLPVVPQVSHQTTTDNSSFISPNSQTIIAPSVPAVRQIPAVVVPHTTSAKISSASQSTAIDVKPDIKTFNLIRPPQSQPPKHKTHIQLASHQPPPQQVVQPIILQQQHHPQSPQHQKQKIWISSLQNNKHQITRSNIVPVPNTSYHIQPTSQPPSSPSVASLAPVKATSNGSPMYSVLYAGTGNKITIKRKPDPVDIKDYPNVRLNPPVVSTSSTSKFLPSTSSAIYTDNKLPSLVQTYHLPIPSTTTVRAHNPSQIISHQFQSQTLGHLPQQSTTQTQHHQLQHVPQPVFRPQQIIQQFQHQQLQQQQNFKKPVIARSKSASAAAAAKRKGCRCGNATPTPGKLTCCGQRCPCYVDAKSCVDCKCRGCRNPHRADGLKVSYSLVVYIRGLLIGVFF